MYKDLKGLAFSRRSVSQRTALETLSPRLLLAADVYTDELLGNWQNWSWETTVDLAAVDPAGSSGSDLAIAATHNQPWVGLYLANPVGESVASGDELRFMVYGGSGVGTISLSVVDASGAFIPAGNVDPTPNAWTEVIIDLSEIDAPLTLGGLVIQEGDGTPGGTFYVDDIRFDDYLDEPIVEPQPGPAIAIDASVATGVISEGIYGLNFADEFFAQEIALSVDRWGGNATSRYNYLTDATNLASDWFFQNYPSGDPNVTPPNLPFGSTADAFVAKDQAVGADTIMTIGMTGWVSKDRNIQGGFPVSLYGAQQEVDPWHPDFGNGVGPDGSFITGNDPTLTSTAVDAQHAIDWISHLVDQFGTAADGGVAYYALDNEPMLWNSTHRDIHPQGASYDEVLALGLEYAAAIKQADPTAEVLGPVSWGWTGYFYSALDGEGEGAWWENPLDRNAHNGMAFLPWYLQEMAAAEQAGGTRLLDYLDVHYYPQHQGVALSGVGDAATQERRLESTRSLWDPSYVDNSWINEEVMLIPRMRDWIDTYYPDTKLAITEYNFGALDHINGAVTQADVLGIFGREGVDIATIWDPPEPNDPAAYAFRMFRNYDGQANAGSRFGETSLQSVTADHEAVSVFASERAADGATTIMLINKSDEPLVTPLAVGAVFDGEAAERYTYSEADLSQIVRETDATVVNGSLAFTLPAESITLIELPAITGDALTIERLESLCSAVAGNGATQSWMDVNSDGNINGADVTYWVEDLFGTQVGDTNLDGKVDLIDLDALGSSWLQSGNSVNWSNGDLNCDGTIDLLDLDLLGAAWGFSAAGHGSAHGSVNTPTPSAGPISARISQAAAGVPGPAFTFAEPAGNRMTMLDDAEGSTIRR